MLDEREPAGGVDYSDLLRALRAALSVVRGVMERADNVCPLCGARIAALGDRHRERCAFTVESRTRSSTR